MSALSKDIVLTCMTCDDNQEYDSGAESAVALTVMSENNKLALRVWVQEENSVKSSLLIQEHLVI